MTILYERLFDPGDDDLVTEWKKTEKAETSIDELIKRLQMFKKRASECGNIRWFQ